MNKKSYLSLMAVLIVLFIILLLLAYLTTYVFVYFCFVDEVEENGVHYSVDKMASVCSVSEYYLNEEQKEYEVVIPDKLEDGTIVETLKAQEIYSFSFEMRDKDLWDISYDENYSEFEPVEYFVHFKIGKNLYDIGDWLIEDGEGKSELWFMVLEKGQIPDKENIEYIIRINVTYSVSEDNRWYYSKDGKLYEKDDIGFWKNVRIYRVWKARMED